MAARRLFAAMAVLVFGVASAAAGTDTLVVTPPPPIPESVPPNAVSSGRDGVWWPVPMPNLGATSIGEGEQEFKAAPPSLLADLGARQRHTIVFDSARQRFIAFGGATQPEGFVYNDVWTRPVGVSGDWTPLSVTGTPPAHRQAHSAAYDPAGDRMIVYGGRGVGVYGDLWQLTFSGGPQWSPLPSTGASPGVREGHTAHFDASRSRMIVFGGLTPQLSSQTWFLNVSGPIAEWQLAAPSGSPPPGRAGHVFAWDPARDQLVIYGGLGSTYLADTWRLRFTPTFGWIQVQSVSPPGARNMASGMLDETGAFLYLTGGHMFQTYPAGLWRLNLTSFAWSQVSASGSTPPARRGAASASDPVSRRGVMHGGSHGAAATQFDTWELAMGSVPAWTLLAGTPSPPPPPPPGPPPPPTTTMTGALRYGAAGAFDPVRGQYWVIGGAVFPTTLSNEVVLLSDFYSLKLGTDSTWVRVTPPGDSFSARFAHSAVYDPVRDRILIFAGYDGTYLRDLYELRLSPSLRLNRLSTALSPPSRDFHAAIYDPVRDRMVIYGGNIAGASLGDVWALSLGDPPQWTQISPAGSPPPNRMMAGAIYDPYSDRMIVFGGWNGTSRNDLWALSLGGTPTWSPLLASGGVPGPRFAHSLQLDPNRQRAVLYGGRLHETQQNYGDLWELSLGGSPSWTQLNPSGESIPARFGHLAFVDPIQDRMLVSGGYGQGFTFSDVWRLQWDTDIPTATTLALISSDVRTDRVELRWGVTGGGSGAPCRLERREPVGTWRTLATTTLDGSGAVSFVDRDVAPGGRYGYRLFVRDAGDDALSAETWIDIPESDGFALHGFSPNPAMGRARVAFSALDSSPATLELVDVHGRRVAHHRVESPARGTATLEIAPEGGLAPGLYFIRLTQGGRTLVRRGSVVE